MLKILDNTLREGEQVPGLHFSPEEKLAIFDLLVEAGVDLIDVGIPGSSPEEAAFCAECARRTTKAIPGGSIRALPEEVDLAVDLGLREVYLMFPYSEIHIENKFRTTVSEMKQCCEQIIGQAISKGLTVNIACEDAARGSLELVCDLASQAADLGAARIFLCDTLGASLTYDFGRMVAAVVDEVGGSCEVGVHCHNDHGLATANTLAALAAGASIASVTLNGLGERAGNAPLHEVVLGAVKLLNRRSNIALEKIDDLSRMAERTSGIFLSPLAPIVGRNAFRHESGIHVDGLLKNSRIYEELKPETVGRRHEITLGKSTGTSYLRKLLAERGIEVTDKELQRLREAVRREALSRDKREIPNIMATLEDYYCRNLDFPLSRFWRLAEMVLGLPQDEPDRENL